ncbi:zinc-dependent alcohol dehydrogenase family protein [Legionella dresdenensis]|uniref:Zinc-dependent alcohol dehydrogenase family protein n=1 Tax=Legionella dresdenensis TaxID=450200 RepID=A0ABV8CCV1_9GAMM
MTNENTMMYAQVVRAFGPAAQAFGLEQVPIPKVNEKQMLIRVLASSVNPVDCKLRSGIYPAAMPEMPAILHSDVVGEVVQCGSAVQQFALGDIVYGCAGGFKGTQGAIAEYMLVDPALMALKPENLTVIESASLPLVGITAWLALFDKANIQPGQKVLIHAASGGVGSIALQLALWKGAQTYVTASDEKKAAFAQERGAIIINYKTTSVAEYVQQHTDGKGFDVVFDTVGGKNLDASLEALKESGVICAIVACAEADLRPLHRKSGTLHYIFMPNTIMNLDAAEARKHYGDILSNIAELAEQGVIKPLVGATVRFSEVAKAHELQEQQQVIGKIVLEQDLQTAVLD